MGDSWFHEIEGVRYPRATSVLGTLREPGIDKYRARVGVDEADKVMRRAAKIGTTVHRLIEKTLAIGKLAKLPAKAPADTQRAWRAWQMWYAGQTDFHPTSGETLLVNHEFGYSGTPDCVEDHPNLLHRVNDWKGTGRIREVNFLQLGCYVPLIWPDTWRTLDPAPLLRVVRVSPMLGLFEEEERPFEPWMMDDLFLPLLKIYRRFYFAPAIAALEARERESAALATY